MYTNQQIETVLKYNKKRDVFRVTNDKRVRWDLLNLHVTELREAGVPINYAEELAQLKKQVRAALIAKKLI